MYHNHFTTILVILGNSLLLDYCFSWISRTFFLAEGGIFIAPFTTEFANTKLLRVHSFFCSSWCMVMAIRGDGREWSFHLDRDLGGVEDGGMGRRELTSFSWKWYGRREVVCGLLRETSTPPPLKIRGEKLDALWFVNAMYHPLGWVSPASPWNLVSYNFFQS